jgi:light-regulated signal transduction histidine kinase (bacteriophytochrome)
VVVFRDVTERVRAEEALERKARELERSNAELKQFADIASHDLQAPLRLIKTYVEVLARRHAGTLDAESARYLDHIVESTGQMITLVNDLLALSRAGAPGVEPEAVDAGVICDRALANLRAAIESERAVVTRGPLPVVSGEPTQLVQLFQNLIGNAIKFHDGGRPHVHVSAGLAGGETVISVQDDGIGIEAGSREEVFRMFKRLHGAARYPGSGIGLAICKKIVERHGGRIWTEPAPAKGSIFRFTLPLGSPPAGPSA